MAVESWEIIDSRAGRLTLDEDSADDEGARARARGALLERFELEGWVGDEPQDEVERRIGTYRERLVVVVGARVGV